MRKVTRSWTFWLTGVAVTFGLFQFVPGLGIVLCILAFFFSLNSILLAAIVVAFAAECLVGVFPRWLAAIPLVLIGGGLIAYGGYYFSARSALSQAEAVLQQRNAQVPTAKFDPQSQSLGLPGLDGTVVLYDNVPAFYLIGSKEPDEHTVEYTVKPRRGCHAAKPAEPFPKDSII